MQKLVQACPALAAAPEFRSVLNLKSLDVIATRIWLDKKVETRYHCAHCTAVVKGPSGFTCLKNSRMSLDLNSLTDPPCPSSPSSRFPANVLSGFEPEAGAGATYFHLNDLQVSDRGGVQVTP